jgi:5-methylcytosine-specific restriction endonuclease McrA
MTILQHIITAARRAHFRRIARIFNYERDVLVRHDQSYPDYLESPHWRRVRYRALKLADFTCRRCEAKDVTLHVHHRTYARLGRERDDDLEVLCEFCHRSEHGLDK